MGSRSPRDSAGLSQTLVCTLLKDHLLNVLFVDQVGKSPVPATAEDVAQLPCPPCLGVEDAPSEPRWSLAAPPACDTAREEKAVHSDHVPVLLFPQPGENAVGIVWGCCVSWFALVLGDENLLDVPPASGRAFWVVPEVLLKNFRLKKKHRRKSSRGKIRQAAGLLAGLE